jgi:hypothetical protein
MYTDPNNLTVGGILLNMKQHVEPAWGRNTSYTLYHAFTNLGNICWNIFKTFNAKFYQQMPEPINIYIKRYFM